MTKKQPPTFARRRHNRVLEFDIQIYNWRKNRKKLGALKNSVTKTAPKKLKNIFNGE